MTLDAENQRRWRLILGNESATSLGALQGEDLRIDEVLEELYEPPSGDDRRGGLGSSSPRVARWLGDIRRYFPQSVVRVMQQDALDRLQLRQMLLEPELLAAAEPDVHLVATLLSLHRLMPQRTRETARHVVRRVVSDLMRRLQEPTRRAVLGALARHLRNPRPRLQEIDWHRTIRQNLQHYQPDRKLLIPARFHGSGRRRSALRDIVLCIDQSGSMASSLVYSSVFGAAMASLPALKTHFVVFDTAVVDLTTELRDPVDLLFGAQLGGGTDIAKALQYCEGLVQRPRDTVMVLVSDLYEGGNAAHMLQAAARLCAAGVRLIVLLALCDDGRPIYDERHAAAFAALDAPVFACTPDLFPELMAAALQQKSVHLWAQQRGIGLQRPHP